MKRLIAINRDRRSSLLLARRSALRRRRRLHDRTSTSRGDVQRIDRLVGGKACAKRWEARRRSGARKTGRKECVLQTPVEGDSKLPNHVLQATGVVKKKTDKKIRSQVYVGLAVRVNARSSYEMRIFPKGRRYKLIKNGNELDSGKNKAINELDQKNRMRLEVNRSDVIAKVNGNGASRQVQGQRPPAGQRAQDRALTYGSEARAKKDGYGTFDSVKVFVPDPDPRATLLTFSRYSTPRIRSPRRTPPCHRAPLRSRRQSGPGSGLGGNWS